MVLLGLSLVGHQLELDWIAATDHRESLFEVFKSLAPMWTTIEVDEHYFGYLDLI